MRIFTRYILREILGYALLGGVLFTFILFMRYLLPLMELAVRGVASASDLAFLVASLLPQFLTVTIPMSVLIGILLGLSRLAADSETTAMRASGLGVVSFVRIASIFATFCWLLSLANTLWVAPAAARALLRYEVQAGSSQASVRVQPRVFYEDFKNYVLYVQEVMPGANGAAVWKHVFLADLTHPRTPHITTADEAVVMNDGPAALRMELADGTRHDVQLNDPNRYDISTFSHTEVPVQTGQQEEDMHLSRKDTPMQATATGELWRRIRSKNATDKRGLRIELHRRLAFPMACFVLMLVGVPLGLSSKRGGKGSGFVLTLVLVFLYYFASSIGIAMARQGKVSAGLGVWGANLIFSAAGILLVQQLARGGIAVEAIAGAAAWMRQRFSQMARDPDEAHTSRLASSSANFLQAIRRILRIRFPLTLDQYVMSSFLRNFGIVLAAFTSLFLIFTFFELIGDIVKNHTPLVTVGDYLLNLIPFVLYNVTPVCALVAVLITFGSLSRTSEMTAMKSAGMSVYRIVGPVLAVSAVIAVLLFAFDEAYLPQANRQQEALLATIKGKPAQTHLRPDRQWMSGSMSGSGKPTRIFYYQFFGPDTDTFANLTVFEFEPGTFNLDRRIFASSVHWDRDARLWIFDNGWQRTFAGDTVSGYNTFASATFPEIRENPSYFKKEQRPSQEMSYSELSQYIRDLEQSGFETVRLRVQLHRKLAYPLVTLVMAILAVPFSLSAGKKGSLAGIGAAVGLAITYWVIAGFFENLGDVNSLPALLAAWSPDVLFAIAGSYLLLRTPT